MVLQRNEPLKIWGWAAINEPVKLKFKQKIYQTKANNLGQWEIQLPAQPAGGPFEFTFTASNTIVLKDILFGDVYLASGQSNMELPMGRLIDQYPVAIANSANTKIRQFVVPDEYDFKEARTDFSSGSWQAANPKTVLEFSGAAYFFALEINKKFNIPVGIINSALGGSPAQAWMSEQAINKFPAYAAELQKFKNDDLIKGLENKDREASNAWYGQLNALDEGLKKNWKAETSLTDWDSMQVPGYWVDHKLGKVNGVVWFKKEIEVPKSMLDQPIKLLLGRIVDADSVYINGDFVGTTSYQYPPRRYLFGKGLLKEGKNTITVRVVNNGGNGGFVLDKDYLLIAGTDTLKLNGIWKYKLGAKMGATPSQTFIRWKPVGLYNAMIAPLKNYGIKGALWYQGESNTGNTTEYGDLMRSLIVDWRITFAKQDLPFIYVQLPNFMEPKSYPSQSSWAELREEQRKLLALKNTAMAIAIDLGEWNDIHPLNKFDVGKRMALAAIHLIYKDSKVVYTGPLFKVITASDKHLTLSFDGVGKGLIAKGGNDLKYFAVAGADHKFIWAKAIIQGDKVLVWNDEIANPLYVRYAWADNPAGANLYNKEGLPATPFEASVK